jgi:hypothetical protein
MPTSCIPFHCSPIMYLNFFSVQITIQSRTVLIMRTRQARQLCPCFLFKKSLFLDAVAERRQKLCGDLLRIDLQCKTSPPRANPP